MERNIRVTIQNIEVGESGEGVREKSWKLMVMPRFQAWVMVHFLRCRTQQEKGVGVRRSAE